MFELIHFHLSELTTVVEGLDLRKLQVFMRFRDDEFFYKVDREMVRSFLAVPFLHCVIIQRGEFINEYSKSLRNSR